MPRAEAWTAIGVWTLILVLVALAGSWAAFYVHVWQGGCDQELQALSGVDDPAPCQQLGGVDKSYAMESTNETPAPTPSPEAHGNG